MYILKTGFVFLYSKDFIGFWNITMIWYIKQLIMSAWDHFKKITSEGISKNLMQYKAMAWQISLARFTLLLTRWLRHAKGKKMLQTKSSQSIQSEIYQELFVCVCVCVEIDRQQCMCMCAWQKDRNGKNEKECSLKV